MHNSSVVSSAVPALSGRRVADVFEVPYSSALLLEARLPMVVLADFEFAEACQIGFDSYFDGMVEGTVEPILVEHRYSVDEVKQEVHENVMVASQRDRVRLPWCVGFLLGWLSALALVQPQEADEGIGLLTTCVDRLQARSLTRRASNATLQIGRA